MSRVRYLIPLIALSLLVLLLKGGLSRDPTELPSPFLNKPAPQFELPSLINPAETMGSADYAGQMVLLNVWATWCPGCRQEHAFLLRLAAEEVLPIYGLDWRDDRAEAEVWLRQLGNQYDDVGYDGDGRVGINWGVYGAPETFLIAADGTVRHKLTGPLDRLIWERDFMPLIEAGESQP